MIPYIIHITFIGDNNLFRYSEYEKSNGKFRSVEIKEVRRIAWRAVIRITRKERKLTADRVSFSFRDC